MKSGRLGCRVVQFSQIATLVIVFTEVVFVFAFAPVCRATELRSDKRVSNANFTAHFVIVVLALVFLGKILASLVCPRNHFVEAYELLGYIVIHCAFNTCGNRNSCFSNPFKSGIDAAITL